MFKQKLNQSLKLKISLIIATSILITVCGIISGCGEDSTADINARQQDRDREQAKQLMDQFKIAAGLYQGSTTSADVYLKVKVTPVSGGAASPTAALTGSLVLIPKILPIANSSKLQNTYTFNNGIFDSATGVLAFSVENNASTVSCKVGKGGALACFWDVSWSKELDMKRTTAQNITELRAKSSSNFVYAGSNDLLNYNIQFQPGTIVRAGSQVPQPAIFGYMTWFDKSLGKAIPSLSDPQVNFSFEDASYDSVNDQISLTLKDPNSTKVTCDILPNESLDCYIYSMNPQEVKLHKTVKK